MNKSNVNPNPLYGEFLQKPDGGRNPASPGSHAGSFFCRIKTGKKIHPMAVQVMNELGIDISSGFPKKEEAFTSESFDFVITVCDSTRENCLVFPGKVRYRLHIGFKDPAAARGTEKEMLAGFRSVRDEIKAEFDKLYNEQIKRSQK